MDVLQVKLYIDVDGSFNKTALEHIDYQVFYTEPAGTEGLTGVLCTKKISIDEIDKVCDIKDEVKSVKGVKKIHYIHHDRLPPPKKSFKKFNHPISIIFYKTILITIAVYLAVEAGRTNNLINMIIVIALSIIVYFVGELIWYLKKDYSL